MLLQKYPYLGWVFPKVHIEKDVWPLEVKYSLDVMQCMIGICQNAQDFKTPQDIMANVKHLD